MDHKIIHTKQEFEFSFIRLSDEASGDIYKNLLEAAVGGWGRGGTRWPSSDLENDSCPKFSLELQ